MLNNHKRVEILVFQRLDEVVDSDGQDRGGEADEEEGALVVESNWLVGLGEMSCRHEDHG